MKLTVSVNVGDLNISVLVWVCEDCRKLLSFKVFYHQTFSSTGIPYCLIYLQRKYFICFFLGIKGERGAMGREGPRGPAGLDGLEGLPGGIGENFS